MDVDPYEHLSPSMRDPEIPWWPDATTTTNGDTITVEWDWHDGVPNGALELHPGDPLHPHALALTEASQ